MRPTQLGQAEFKSILSEDVDWKPFPAFPPKVRLAVVAGQPSEPGSYTIRVKAPHGEKLMPHKHPEDRVYTVISGVFYVGLGDEFDASKLEAYPPGAVVILPEIRPISTGRNRVNTLLKSQGSGRSVSNTLIPTTIRELKALRPPSNQEKGQRMMHIDGKQRRA